jgi:hypothetical protein
VEGDSKSESSSESSVPVVDSGKTDAPDTAKVQPGDQKGSNSVSEGDGGDVESVPPSSSVEGAGSKDDEEEDPSLSEPKPTPPIDKTENKTPAKQDAAPTGMEWKQLLLQGLSHCKWLPDKSGTYHEQPPVTYEHPEHGNMLMLFGTTPFANSRNDAAYGKIALGRDENDQFFYLARTNLLFAADIPVHRSEQINEWFDRAISDLD